MIIEINNTKKELEKLFSSLDFENADVSSIELYLKNHINIKNLLSIIISDVNYLQKIAKLSYRHKNGFHKFVLLNSQYYKLRLHIWDKKELGPNIEENIHNHRWYFSTLILSGKYLAEEYDFSDEGEDFYFYEYNPQNKKILSKGIKKLKKQNSKKYSKKDCYSVTPDLFHKVTNISLNGYTATLVLQSKPVKDKISVFSKYHYEDKPDTFFNSPYNPQEVKDKLQFLINYIDTN